MTTCFDANFWDRTPDTVLRRAGRGFEADLKRLGGKTVMGAALLGAVVLLAPWLRAQEQPAPTKTPATDQNPFPDDTSAVPIMPSRSTADLPPEVDEDAAKGGIPLPADDADPVRSPEEAAEAAESGQSSYSSSRAGTTNAFPAADDDTQPAKRGRKGSQIEEHQETAAGDVSVGSYYLDKKNWRAALSRFQSALVLDPDNPEVYWGLAESQRHLNDLAGARANYQKVVEYDPDSRHGKEAQKALKDPEIANAKPAAPAAVAPKP
jgi:hypothetical protein